MIITIVGVVKDLRDDVTNLGCDIIRDAPDTGLDIQVDTSKFTVRISGDYVRLRNKEIRRTLLIYGCEFRSIDVR